MCAKCNLTFGWDSKELREFLGFVCRKVIDNDVDFLLPFADRDNLSEKADKRFARRVAVLWFAETTG